MIRALLLFVVACTSALISRAGVSVDSTRVNRYDVYTFKDTVFDPTLPAVEFRHNTYNNMNDVTTGGFKVILRGGEIEITGVDLYKADSRYNIHEKFETFYPLHLHLGDSTERNVIRHVYVYPRFPFTTNFYGEDSLVIHTNKGDKSVYLMEEFRMKKAYKTILNDMEAHSRWLEHLNYVLYGFLGLLLVTIIVIVIRQRNARIRQIQERDRLMTIISENEMNNRQLKEAVTSQLRKNFETINKLCYEYFELADSPALKKSIYSQVENEIRKLREPSKLQELEESLNKFCDNIMVRVDEQLPDLSPKERTLLLYLYSGLSARTICILTDIQVKNFYMRRQRLKAKINVSGAPDREIFTQLM
ncbi:MAG: hypothetical protein K2F99_06080 [Muribaculaceae bacterium]|nr:hypothetical protein [Muribaculaceae bacterium]